MRYKKTYYVFPSAFSNRLCDEIVENGMKNKPDAAFTGNRLPRNEKEVKDVKQKRDSNVSWLDGIWIMNEIEPYIRKANKAAGWNFDIVWPEHAQFTVYNKGHYYGWHTDSSGHMYESEIQKGLIRKLSVTVSLSHPHEYEGGLLEFNIGDMDKQDTIQCAEILPRGSICVFPSYTEHRVTPVTKGKRMSLVQWTNGPEWR